MSDSKISNFIKGSAILVLANMMIKAINFFLLPLYTKYLTPTELGISDSITNVTAILMPILMLGLDSAFSAFYFDERTEEHKSKVFNTSLITLIVAGITPFIIAIFSKDISLWLFNTEKHQILVAVSLITISFNLWYTPYALHARMENRMLLFAAVNVSASLLMIASNIVFVSVMQLGAFALILSSALVQLFQLLAYLVFLPKLFKYKEYDKALLHRMLKYSIPLIPTAIAAWFLNLSDRYFLLHYFSAAEVGIYGIGARFSSLLSVLSNAVFTAYTTFAFDKKDDEDAKYQYKRVLSFYYMILMITCIIVTMWGKEIIELMSNSAYGAAYLLLPGLLFGQVMYGISVIVGYGLSFTKRTNYILAANVIGALLNIVLNILLIPSFGPEAAAYTTYIGYFVMAILLYVFGQKFYPCDYGIVKLIISNVGVIGLVSFMNHYEMGLGLRVLLTVATLALMSIFYRDAIKDIFVIFRRIKRKIRG